MSKRTNIALAILSVAAFGSCSKMGPLTADNFTVTPSPMVAEAGNVDVTINGRFPEKYMKRKAVVTVTPVLKYAGHSADGQSATFQGEKVEGNNQTVSYKIGGNYTMKSSFKYVPDMLKSELYLTFDAKKGRKTVIIPEVKVADGVIATSELLRRTVASASPATAPDAFEHVIAQKQEASINFLIQQAKIRNSELKKTSVQDFVQTLRDIKADQNRKGLSNVEISAYASPDGGVELNDKLAAQRESTTKDYLDNVLKEQEIETNVDAKYTAEDWEGFQELVSASNIQDKEVILRVLSMYTDPEQREQQIKNISSAFRELADEILPQLRRSRLTINYELIGRSDDEIQAQFKSDASQLSLEELLYATTLTESSEEQEAILKKAAELHSGDYRAYNNLAAISYSKGDLNAAKNYLTKANGIKANNPESSVNLGLIELANGNVEEAENYMTKGNGANNYNEALGNLEIAKGNYAQAVSYFKGVNSNSAALAQILSKDYDSAAKTLAQVKNPDATTSYLKAIAAARTGDKASAFGSLKEAVSKDSSYASYGAKDLEFAQFANDAEFQDIVK